MPYDGKVGLRELSKPQVLPVSANGQGRLQVDNASPRHQRRSLFKQLFSRQYLCYWLIWLLLFAGLAIKQSTRVLDAASEQHHLLTGPNTPAATAATAGAAVTPAAHSIQHAEPQHKSGGWDTKGLSVNSSEPADVLAAQQKAWPDGYVAVCAVVKDQWPDLRYWIEYHRWLGVSKFYIYDNNSTLPSMLMLWDYMQEGLVEYQYFLGRPRRKPDFTDTNQYRAYQACLLQHFKQHRWLAYIDADEFFVFPQQQQQQQQQQDDVSAGGASTLKDSSTGEQQPGIPLLSLDQPQQQPADSDSRDLPRNTRGAHDAHVQQLVLANQLGGLTPQAAAATAVSATVSGTNLSASSVSLAMSEPISALGSSSSSSSSEQYQHNLALFLSDFEGHAAVGVNWVLFGSSKHQVRPPEGPLAAYTSCVPSTHWESTHVKVIANTGGIFGMGFTPHEVLPRPGKTVVDVDQQPMKGPKTKKAKWHKLVLHHYVLKSKAEFVAKKERGSGAGNRKDWAYWDYIEGLANQTCTQGVAVGKAFMESSPRINLPEAAHVMHGCHSKAAAAYEDLVKPGGSQSGTAGEQQQQLGELAGLLPC